MKALFYTIFIFLAVIIFSSCKEPYMPDIKNPDTKVLVVEGYIDGGNQTIVKLSYTRQISNGDTAAITYPTQARVVIEDRNGIFYSLTPRGDGVFSSLWYLAAGNDYRLHIFDGDDEYVSSFLPLKVSPRIDLISLDVDGDGAHFSVSTHDNSGKSTFYRWQYDETWEFHSTYETKYKFDPYEVQVVARRENVHVCWQFGNSKEILIGSSAKFSQDVIDKKPLLVIPRGDIRLGVLYSLMVRQYAVDSLEYQFWSQLKKNTEDVGTIFDPQPNNIRGNITCVNDTSRIVVGYVGVGISTTRRQFFKTDWDYRAQCAPVISVPNIRDSLLIFFSNRYTPLMPEMVGDSIARWKASDAKCTDCTLRGTNVKPPYWP